MIKQPIIIDTDPGIDDTLAIIMMAANEDFEIKAMTATHGNVGLDGTSKNALNLSEYLNINCPVAKGASKPMIVSQKEASEFHGKNGIAGFELPQSKDSISDELAWDMIYRIAKQEQGRLKLLVLGPMTNIAIATLKYPDLKNYIQRIYMMGGSRSFGNHSQYAEFNIWSDPHACEVVLHSGIPITMCDLVFGNEHYFTGKQLENAYSKAKRIKPLMDAFLKFDKKDMSQEVFENFKYTIYDTTVAAALILQDEVVCEDYYVMCETQGSQTEGQTVFDYLNHAKQEPNVQLAVSMDKDKYYELFCDAISYFE